MTGDQTAGLIWGVGALVLVLSAFAARRMPLGQTVRLALGWVAIFAVAIVIVSQRDVFARIWGDVSRDLFGAGQEVQGQTIRVAMAEDGHFWVDAEINGRSTRLMVDSGATTTAVSRGAARAAGIDIDAGGLPVIISTANGDIEAQRARIERMTIGPIQARDLPVVVSDAFGDTNVLGMNFLSQLRGWRVEGRFLILDPQPPA